MSKVMYDEFYFPPINDNEKFEVLEEFYKTYDSRGKYDGNIFCPECTKAELKFTPEAKSHRAFLSAIDANQHDLGCSYKYDVSSTRRTRAYFERLSDSQVQDKMASILRMLNRQNNVGGAGSSYVPGPSNNPFVLEFDDNQSSRVRRSLPRRNLDKTLKKEDADLLYAFYAKGAKLEVEIKPNDDPAKKTIFYLHIETTSGKKYRIYRGIHQDDVSTNSLYDVVLIGSFQEQTLSFARKHINLIERETKYGLKPNQFAIAIQ